MYKHALVGAALLVGCGATDPVSPPDPPSSTSPPSAQGVPSPDAPPTTGSPPVTPPTGAPPATPPAPKAKTATECFKALTGPVAGPDYDQFKPKVGDHCAGTAHQAITGVEKVVFLGDSVTVGTPPTLPQDFYRSVLTRELQKKFGQGLEIKSCAEWGARNDDFIGGKDELAACFPGATENKKTLVVMTMGGNDIASWAKDKLTTAQATAAADTSAALLRGAIDWLKAPGRFVNGVYVVFANVYEYTDTSGDMASCPTATLAGMSGSWPQGKPAVVHFQEQYMKIAVETQTDMAFMLERFCGHGYKRKDASLQCYRGPGAELWFDATCIHPTPKGHAQIADMFLDVIGR